MAMNTRVRTITWPETNDLLYFFYEEITSLIPDLWEQKSKSNNEVSLTSRSCLKVNHLLAKIYSKHVKIDSNQDKDHLNEIISDVTSNFPKVRVSIVAPHGNILLESLVKEQLDFCETFVQLQLSGIEPPRFQSGAFTQISGASGNSILNIDEQDQVIASFHLPCKLKLDIYSEDVTVCNVGAIITVQNHGKYNDVMAVGDNNSKYLLCVKEPSRDFCSGDQNAIQEYVASIFYQCFEIAVNLNITSMATTMIFAGQLGIPMDTILFSIVQALNQFMNNQVTESCLKEIHIVDHSPETCKVMEQFFTLYWPKKISLRKSDQPYSTNRNPRRFQNASVNSAAQSLDYPTRRLSNLSLHGNRRSVATPKGMRNRNMNASEERSDQNEDCQICFQTLTFKKTLKCKHSFCQHCLDTWLQVKKSCPLCREPVY